MIYTEKITLAALPPFHFDLSSEIFANGDNQIRNYKNGRFWQVIRVNDKLILAIIKSAGTVDKPKVAAELKSRIKITEKDKKKAEETVAALFSLDYDLNPFLQRNSRRQNNDVLNSRALGTKKPNYTNHF